MITIHLTWLGVLAVFGGAMVLRYLIPMLWGLWLLWRWDKH